MTITIDLGTDLFSHSFCDKIIHYTNSLGLNKHKVKVKVIQSLRSGYSISDDRPGLLNSEWNKICEKINYDINLLCDFYLINKR